MVSPSDSKPDERQPLLNDGKVVDNGTIERASDDNGGSSNQETSLPGGDNGNATIEGDAVIVESEEPSTLSILKVMAPVYLGTFLAALDSTLVATLSGPIISSFNSLYLFSWLASGYFIANAALQPLAGKLTDISGRRAGLIFSNTFFAAGNLICGLAPSGPVMILGRVVAGMGGGGLNAISTFIASDLIPLRRRGVWQGFGNIMFGLGAGVGGVFGGFMNDVLSWRWAFLVQVPLTLAVLTVVIFVVRIPVRDDLLGIPKLDRWRRIDFLGAGLLVSTLVLMLLGLNSGGNIVPWTHPLVLTTLPLSLLSLLAYIYVEARVAAEPIIPVHLLATRTVLASCLTNWFTTMAVFGISFYVPIYFQARGYSATQAGARLASQSLGIAAGSILTGLLMRRLGRYWWPNMGALSCAVLGLALIASTLDAHTPDLPPFIYLSLVGGGYSGMLTVTLISLISAVEHRWQAVITSASYAFRSTGSTIGITIASAVFQNVLGAALWARLGDWPGAAEWIPRVRDSLDAIKRLPPPEEAGGRDWRVEVVEAYMVACRAVFLTLLGLGTLGLLAAAFIREHKLHSTLSRRDS